MPEQMVVVAKVTGRTASTIKTAVLERDPRRAAASNFFIQEEVIQPSESIPIPRQSVEAERPTVMVFVDDAPLMNWAHRCRYLLHDAESGQLYREIEAQFPPYVGERDTPKSYRAFHEPVRFPSAKIYRMRRPVMLRPRAIGERYAILFSGMSNNRHTNDLEFLYRTLIDVYGYSEAKIIVLNYDGTLNYDGAPQPASKWPGDGSAYRMPLNGEGSRANLLGALDDVRKRLKAPDRLLIHTNNHGGHDGAESNLCCYPNWDSLGVREFTDKLAELPEYRCLTVMMEQCHSGGFNPAVISKSTAHRTSIASACEELKNSIGGADFDPFARDWIGAMARVDPYGHALAHDPDTNHDGQISAAEAFHYADSIHNPYDTPVYNQTNGGDECNFGRDLLRIAVPPLAVDEIISKHWPEPDPRRQERVRAILPGIETIEKDLASEVAQARNKAAKRLAEIAKQAQNL